MNKRKRKSTFFWIRVTQEYHARTTGISHVYPLENKKIGMSLCIPKEYYTRIGTTGTYLIPILSLKWSIHIYFIDHNICHVFWPYLKFCKSEWGVQVHLLMLTDYQSRLSELDRSSNRWTYWFKVQAKLKL